MKKSLKSIGLYDCQRQEEMQVKKNYKKTYSYTCFKTCPVKKVFEKKLILEKNFSTFI